MNFGPKNYEMNEEKLESLFLIAISIFVYLIPIKILNTFVIPYNSLGTSLVGTYYLLVIAGVSTVITIPNKKRIKQQTTTKLLIIWFILCFIYPFINVKYISNDVVFEQNLVTYSKFELDEIAFVQLNMTPQTNSTYAPIIHGKIYIKNEKEPIKMGFHFNEIYSLEALLYFNNISVSKSGKGWERYQDYIDSGEPWRSVNPY